MSIAEAIATTRNEMGMSRPRFSAYTGLTVFAIMSYETNRLYPTRQAIERLMELFGERFRPYLTAERKTSTELGRCKGACPGAGVNCFSCPLPECNGGGRIQPWETEALHVNDTVVRYEYLADTPWKQVRYLRSKLNMTRPEFARKLGIDLSLIYSIEDRQIDPDERVRRKVKRIFGYDITEAKKNA